MKIYKHKFYIRDKFLISFIAKCKIMYFLLRNKFSALKKKAIKTISHFWFYASNKNFRKYFILYFILQQYKPMMLVL